MTPKTKHAAGLVVAALTATVTFTPTKAGIFVFYCRFQRSSGMTGSMVVSSGSSCSSESPSPASSGAGANGGYGGGY